ncbi:MAG: Nucleotidyltransferase protein [archaeon GW2011_AR13]|nr:MAG: Nucleotidyltransferase protein [archaeon GW2011_AR13]HIG94092.1 hypothetical protein [Nanoarchaeota archaeon]HIH63327.1 hypothetical protein [Nanoarchaeota archaeon]HIJ09944.1 hypothetical protein [Nanoarchaeota archaeon]
MEKKIPIPKIPIKKKEVKKIPNSFPKKTVETLNLATEHDIAMDFAVKVYKKYDKMIKSVVLFGSTVKQDMQAGSDVDIIIILDDVTIAWDQELISWYREELEKILRANPYNKKLHINTVKLSTWWEDLVKGDPTILNVIRYGEAMIDLAGFFEPLKSLLIKGKIKSTPEAIYSCLQRAPIHLARSKTAELGAIEGLYWSMVDSAHAALISAKVIPASPEHIPMDLKETFVDTNVLDSKYVNWYTELLELHKKIGHGEIKDLKGVEIDLWQEKAEKFLEAMIKIVNDIIENK